MRILKKIIRKIYHLIWFLSLFLIFSSPVNAQSTTLSFNRFNTTAESLSSNIQCNNNLCVVYSVPFYNYPMNFEWGTTSSPTCSSGAVITGILYNDNSGFGINNNDFSWSSVYIVNNNQKTNCAFSVGENGTNYTCSVNNLVSGWIIGFSLNNNFGGQVSFNSSIVRVVDINCDTSTSQIIQNQQQNTQSIINNNNNNTQSIIGNNNQNTQSIIDSSGSNTQSIIDNQNENSNKEIESQKVCNTKKYSYNNSSYQENSYLTINGQINQNQNYTISDYIQIGTDSTLKITEKASTGSGYLNVCFYNENKTLISCTSTYNIQSQLTIPDNTKFVRFTFRNNNLPLYELSTCIGGNQALNDTLTDDTTPDIDLDLTTASDTPISDLITMPLTILNGLYQTLTDSCTNYTLPFFYSTSLTFPCFTISDYLGTNITNYIDLFICLYMCYNIAMLVISVFEDITSLRDIYDSLYEPKHAYTGYHPKHAKGE